MIEEKQKSEWHNSTEVIPDNCRDILIMWGDNGITQGFFQAEDNVFYDSGTEYTCSPHEDVWWMDIPPLPE